MLEMGCYSFVHTLPNFTHTLAKLLLLENANAWLKCHSSNRKIVIVLPQSHDQPGDNLFFTYRFTQVICFLFNYFPTECIYEPHFSSIISLVCLPALFTNVLKIECQRDP